MPRIPDEIIDEVRQASDIVDVIGQHLPLKKAGQNYRTLCPFHQEKTPSFNVNPKKQIWHCFGCGKGGNVFTFLTEYEKVSFLEAVRTLAQKAGISLPAAAGPAEGHDLLYQANEFAARFFQNCLAGQAGAGAREYLTKRAMAQDAIDLFRLGYAPNSWDELLKAAERAGLSQALLAEVGLIVPRESGTGYYDRFRHRIVFPFFSLSGRVVGFGGRSLEQSPQAKYLNSPETALYHKGRGFYGFAQTRPAIAERESAILVEGNFDMLSPWQAGYKNIVATAGTALTLDQAKLLSRYARVAVLCYDPDGPGQAAAERALEPLLEAGLDVKVAVLAAGSDPDLTVRQQGAAAFGQAIESALSFIGYKVMRARTSRDLSQVSEKSQLVNGLISLVARVEDPVKRRLYFREIAEAAGLEEALVMDLARKRQGLKPGATAAEEAGPAAEQHAGWDQEIMGLLLRRPMLIPRLTERVHLKGLFGEAFVRTLARIEAMYQESGALDEPALFHGAGSPEEQGLVSAALGFSKVADDSLDNAEEDERRLAEYLAKLEQQSLKPRLKALQQAIQEAQKKGDAAREKELLMQYSQLARESGR